MDAFFRHIDILLGVLVVAGFFLVGYSIISSND